jgi:hypothetical protein
VNFCLFGVNDVTIVGDERGEGLIAAVVVWKLKCASSKSTLDCVGGLKSVAQPVRQNRIGYLLAESKMEARYSRKMQRAVSSRLLAISKGQKISP